MLANFYFSIYFNPLFLVLILAIKQVVFDLHGMLPLDFFFEKVNVHRVTFNPEESGNSNL